MTDPKPRSVILGIDPGMQTGVATYIDGELAALQTMLPWTIGAWLINPKPDMVIFEDSRLQSFMWTTAVTKAAAAKMARNVGQVDAWCRLIEAECERLGIKAIGRAPVAKGKKTDAETFTRLTGWTHSSNEHTRDAAMVAWPYRRARALL